jgi:hypothetical protein
VIATAAVPSPTQVPAPERRTEPGVRTAGRVVASHDHQVDPRPASHLNRGLRTVDRTIAPAPVNAEER